MREPRLINDGSVCEDAHSYQDPGVRTAADAQALGRQKCPYFQECVYIGALDKRNVRCAAMFGQHVASFTVKDGTSVEEEMADFRDQAWQQGHNGFIDPYVDPDVIITDHEEAAAVVENWARTILYGPGNDPEAETDSEDGETAESEASGRSLPSFPELVASARTKTGAIDIAKIEEAGQHSTKTNGGVRCDVSSGPCSCGAWH